jgi:hypothetical protein
MAAIDEVIDVDGSTYWNYIAVMSSFVAALAFNEFIKQAQLVLCSLERKLKFQVLLYSDRLRSVLLQRFLQD